MCFYQYSFAFDTAVVGILFFTKYSSASTHIPAVIVEMRDVYYLRLKHLTVDT
jgi:hypothetical protein